MTDKNIKQIESQLPDGEIINRMYKAYEGDIRVITQDRSKNEHRYTVVFDREFNATIKPM